MLRASNRAQSLRLLATATRYSRTSGNQTLLEIIDRFLTAMNSTVTERRNEALAGGLRILVRDVADNRDLPYLALVRLHHRDDIHNQDDSPEHQL